MLTSTVDDKRRVQLRKLVIPGETWAAERTGDRIELVRLVKSKDQGKGRLRLEALSLDELRDLVRFSRLSKREQAAKIRAARKSPAPGKPGTGRVQEGEPVSPSRKSVRLEPTGGRKTPDA